VAAPTTGYGTATITNPSAALTDFSLMIDLSTMHASWWTEQNDADGTKGRAYKSDGTTELPCDWIDFDGAGETGWLRVSYDGTLASSGTQTIRIYPPHSDNAAVAAGAAYGSDNAYNWYGYWADGGITDRTGNGHTGSETGGISSGDTTGPLGKATTFDGTDNEIDLSTMLESSNYTVLLWMYSDGGTYNRLFSALSGMEIRSADPETNLNLRDLGGNYGETVAFSVTTWTHVAAIVNHAVTTASIRVDDGTPSEDTDTGSEGSGNDNWIIGGRDGSSGDGWAGKIQEVQVHNSILSDAWITEEYAQTDDNATFWGTWGWTAAGGGIAPIAMRYRMAQ